MPQATIFGPFFAMVLLTFVVWLYMYVRRLHFIASNNINPQDLAVASAMARQAPASVATPSDNLKNLFEIPVVFYALVLYLFATGQVDATYVGAAWLFVAFRVLHSLVHSTFNRVTLRFALYMISTCTLWFIALRAALAHFGAHG